MTKSKIETNPKNCLDVKMELPSRALLMVTVPQTQDYWLFRVALTRNQAITAVPVFGGVDFRLQTKGASEYIAPSEGDTGQILGILRERMRKTVADKKISEAIRLLQQEVRKWRGVFSGTARRKNVLERV